MSHLTIAPLLLPLLAGVLILLLGERRLAAQRALSLAAVALSIPLALLLLSRAAQGEIAVYALGNWPAPFGIVLVADRLSAFMLTITALLSAFALAHAVRGDDRLGPHFHVLFQLQLFGLNGAFLTGDLFNLFVFFEVLLLASYGLVLHGGGRARTRAGLHYVVINLIGSTLFLFAVGALYGVLGTLNMADLAVKIATLPEAHTGVVRAAGLLLLVVFAIKAALLPLHMWLPGAYAGTSAGVAALFAIMTKVGAYSILRVYTLIFGADAVAGVQWLAEPWLLPLALATLALGVGGALASRALREQIAYLVLASAGTLLVGFGLFSVEGISAGLYYLAHSTFAAAALFLLADRIVLGRGAMADRYEAGPPLPHPRLIGGVFFALAVLIAGLPPLAGFFGKLALLQAALTSPALVWIWAVVLIGGLLTVIALARSGSLLFYRAHGVPQAQANTPLGDELSRLAPIFGLLALGLLLVVEGEAVLNYTRATAEQLLVPAPYIEAVLHPVATQEARP